MNVDEYTFQHITSYCDIDTKYVMKNVCKLFAKIKIAIISNNDNWSGIHNNSLRLTKKNILDKPRNWDQGLYFAYVNNNTEIIELLMKRGVGLIDTSYCKYIMNITK